MSSTTKHLRLEWHKTKDLLAVSSINSNNGGFISFFTKKGGKPFFSSKIKNQNSPTTFNWHPIESLLAIGWENGNLNLVDPIKRTESNNLDAELKCCKCILWDNEGLLLVVVDEIGDIHCFKFDVKESHLEHLCNVKAKDELPRDLCFKQIPKKLLQSANNTKERKIISAGKDQRQSSASKTGENTLTELINKHKRMNELQSFGDNNNNNNKEIIKGRRRFAIIEEITPIFLLGTESGSIYLFNPENKQIKKIFQADSGIRQLLDMPQQNYFLAITDEMMFYQLTLDDKLNDKIKVKLAAKSKHFQMILAGFGIIAFAYGDREIRIWDLEAEDSTILRLKTDKGYEASDEQIIMLSYLPKKDSICGLTNKWRLATWRRIQQQNNYLNENTNNNTVKSLIDQQWKLANAISLNIQQVIGMAWSNNSAAFALNSGDSVQIFLSQCIEFFVDSDYAVIQVSAQLLNLVKITDPIETQELQLHSNIRGFFVTENYLTLWDDTKIQLDKIHCPESSPIKIENVASFDVNNIIQAAYYNQHIYTLANEQLLVRTLQGTVKRSITFREIEGKPELINVKGCWLCVASSLGYIRIYDLNERLINN